jgi:hypothetical protein
MLRSVSERNHLGKSSLKSRVSFIETRTIQIFGA